MLTLSFIWFAEIWTRGLLYITNVSECDWPKEILKYSPVNTALLYFFSLPSSSLVYIHAGHGMRERDMSQSTPYQINLEKTCPAFYQHVMHSLAVTQQGVSTEKERLHHSTNSRSVSASWKIWPILDSQHGGVFTGSKRMCTSALWKKGKGKWRNVYKRGWMEVHKCISNKCSLCKSATNRGCIWTVCAKSNVSGSNMVPLSHP